MVSSQRLVCVACAVVEVLTWGWVDGTADDTMEAGYWEVVYETQQHLLLHVHVHCTCVTGHDSTVCMCTIT